MGGDKVPESGDHPWRVNKVEKKQTMCPVSS